MTQLFNKRALQKRHRVGDRNGPVTLLTPPLKATLGFGLLIAIGGAVWATLARIPLSVKGTGVLLPVSTINASLSGTDGRAYWMFNRPPEPWQNRARQFNIRPEEFNDQQITDLAEQLLAAAQDIQSRVKKSSSSADAYVESQRRRTFGNAINSGRLLLWIQSSAQLEQLSSSHDELKRFLRDIAAQEQNVDAKQNILQQELKSRSSYLSNMKGLEMKGFVSRTSILQEQAQVDNLRSQIINNRNEMIRLSNQRNQAYRKLRNELAKLINQEMIFAPHTVYLAKVVPNIGQRVSNGDVVLKLSDDPLNKPTLVPIFLSSKEMAQVFPGMKALATPSGYKRSEVGGIRAHVVSMEEVPSNLQDVSARVGVQSLAQVIINREPAPTLAVLALHTAGKEAPLNSGGYIWSSSGDLPFPPTPGDRIDVEVTTRYIAPIEVVLPTLRRFFGMSPPEPPDQVQLGG